MEENGNEKTIRELCFADADGWDSQDCLQVDAEINNQLTRDPDGDSLSCRKTVASLGCCTGVIVLADCGVSARAVARVLRKIAHWIESFATEPTAAVGDSHVLLPDGTFGIFRNNPDGPRPGGGAGVKKSADGA